MGEGRRRGSMPRLLSILTIMAWISRMEAFSHQRPLMDVIKVCAESVISRHRSGCTEAMYQRLLQAELYHRNIPSLAEVDVFTMSGAVPVHMGRLDLEVDHRVILELKVAPRVLPKHIRQLQKYVRARASTGMHVESAAVVCWKEDDTVEIHPIQLPVSPYFRLRCNNLPEQ